jgi:hypothetical protein
LSTLIPSVICVHFLSTCRLLYKHRHTPYNTIDLTRAQILGCALEYKVACDDTNDEVVDH